MRLTLCSKSRTRCRPKASERGTRRYLSTHYRDPSAVICFQVIYTREPHSAVECERGSPGTLARIYNVLHDGSESVGHCCSQLLLVPVLTFPERSGSEQPRRSQVTSRILLSVYVCAENCQARTTTRCSVCLSLCWIFVVLQFTFGHSSRLVFIPKATKETSVLTASRLSNLLNLLIKICLLHQNNNYSQFNYVFLCFRKIRQHHQHMLLHSAVFDNKLLAIRRDSDFTSYFVNRMLAEHMEVRG